MLLKEIGAENLPNAYFRSLEINDNGPNTLVRITIILKDIRKDRIFQWIDDPILYNYLSLTLVQSSNVAFSDSITDGTYTLNKSDYSSSPIFSEEAVRSQIKSVKINGDVESFFSHIDSDGNDVYEIPYTFDMLIPNDDLQNITYFAAVTVDFGDLVQKFPIDATKSDYIFYQGPISSEVVFSNSRVTKKSFVFLLPDGTYWNGPVHVHNDQFMAGAFHSTMPHPVLEQKEIVNYKLKDRREKSVKEKKVTYNDNRNDYFGIPSDTFDQFGNLKIVFPVDMYNVYRKTTKYGNLIFNLSPSLFAKSIENFEVKYVKILRSYAKRYEYKDAFLTSGKDFTVSGDSTEVSLIKSGKLIIDKANQETSIVKTFGNKSNNLQTFNADLQKVDLLSDRFKFYSYTDYEFKDIKYGKYAYQIELHFIDRTKDFLASLLEAYRLDIVILQRYYNRSIKKGVFSTLTNTFSDKFILIETGTENEIAWNKPIANYLDLLNYLNIITPDQRVVMSHDLFNSINPKSGSPGGILSFIENYQNQSGIFQRRFDLNKKMGAFQAASSRKETFVANWPQTIKISYLYHKVFTSNNLNIGYNIIDFNEKQKNLVQLSRKKFGERIDFEKVRFFRSDPALEQADKQIFTNEEYSALMDTNTYVSSYMSPIGLRNKAMMIDLSRTDLVDDTNLNQALNQIESVSAILNPVDTNIINPQLLQVVSTSLVNDTINYAYPPVANYLGSGSLIEGVDFQFTLEELETNQIPYVNNKLLFPMVTPPRQQTFINSFDLTKKDNNIYNLLRNKNDNTLSNIRKMPNHIKAIISSRSNTIRATVLNSPVDLFASDETANKMMIQYFAIQIIEFFDGYEFGLDGEPLMNKPVWKMLDKNAFDTLKNKKVLCRMRRYSDEIIGIKLPDYLELQVFNKIFVLNVEDPEEPLIENAENNLLIGFNENRDTPLDYTTSNVVTQSRKIKGTFNDPAIQSAPEDTTPTQTRQGRRTRGRNQRNNTTRRY